jgi:hypothetical protein
MDTRMETMISVLAAREPLQPLSPKGIWQPALDEQIEAMSADPNAGGRQSNETYALAVKAGLHLWNDSLDKSHTLSQDIENDTGSYWHGIMHRMEPDYSNAEYWFRKVGVHPAFAILQARVSQYLRNEAHLSSAGPGEIKSLLNNISQQSAWNPYMFIDAIQMQESGKYQEDTRNLLENIQRLEIAVLLQYSYKQSCGGSILESL